jgi:hypothetical protein
MQILLPVDIILLLPQGKRLLLVHLCRRRKPTLQRLQNLLQKNEVSEQSCIVRYSATVVHWK